MLIASLTDQYRTSYLVAELTFWERNFDINLKILQSHRSAAWTVD